MTLYDLLQQVKDLPLSTPVNVHIEYKSGLILRAPGVELNYIDSTGTIVQKRPDDLKEISFFVQEGLLGLKRKENG